MVTTPPPVSLYATRWKSFLAVPAFSGGIAIDLLHYFVWPTPPTPAYPWEYQEPAKTILFIMVLLGCAAIAVVGLYWTLTPRPMLQVSAARLVFRRFPLPTRAIHWEDVEHVSAGVTRKTTSPVTHATILTLWFTPKPDRLAAGNDQQPLRLDIRPWSLSLRADDLVQLIRTYHDVQWLQKNRYSPTT
jgi:hypothetical protein